MLRHRACARTVRTYISGGDGARRRSAVSGERRDGRSSALSIHPAADLRCSPFWLFPSYVRSRYHRFAVDNRKCIL